MKVTRDVVTDLLPLYFSGEVSEDTRHLVEGFFRENPDFERVARAAAKPLEGLRNAAPAASEAEKEKREMQRIGWELRSRRGWLVLAVFTTLYPFLPLVSGQLDAWLGAPHTWGGRITFWSIAAFLWLLYIIRPARRNVTLAWAIFISAGEITLILNRLGVVLRKTVPTSNPIIFAAGLLAAMWWFLYFRSRMAAQR